MKNPTKEEIKELIDEYATRKAAASWWECIDNKPETDRCETQAQAVLLVINSALDALFAEVPTDAS